MSSQETLREKVIVITIQSLIFAALIAGFGFFLDMRLEASKAEITRETERLKTLMEFNSPIIRERQAAYLEIREATREATDYLEIYYYLSTEPIEQDLMRYKLRSLASEMGIGSGTGRSRFVTKQGVVNALERIILLQEKNENILSESINSAVRSYLETVMEDLRKAELQENDTESFHTAARSRAKDAFGHLDRAILEAAGLDKLPIE